MKMVQRVAGVCLVALVGASRAGGAMDYAQTVESLPGLMAYYRFSGNTNSSVNGYTGTLTAGASLDVAGSGPTIPDDPTNQALKLTGASGNELQSSLNGGVTLAGTILAWINLAQLPSNAGRIFYVAGQSTVGDDFDLQVQSDNRIYFYTDAGGSVNSSQLTAASVGQWMFIAATFTAGGDRNLYVNGTLVGSNVPGAHSASSDAFTIGYSDVFGGRAFNGDIDEVAFYNTDLSGSQIRGIAALEGIAAPVPEAGSLGVLGVGVVVMVRRRGLRAS